MTTLAIDERELTFGLAYLFVTEVDTSFKPADHNPHHFRTRDGRLLKTLDEVVRAALAGELEERR